MWAATQVTPTGVARLGIDVVVDREFGSADFHHVGIENLSTGISADQPQFVRLVSQLRECLIPRNYPPAEPLAAFYDQHHLLLNFLQILWLKGFGQIEFVIEPIRYGRANAQFCAGN